ncbi:hypothetical protein Tco_0820936 [Tanacetum coccineum]|uniref:Uncharacterized protein n=1 Tax=Tanacetum coccineum TaxID=301880 RepID=A0ABQ5ADU7_9ASTR
MEYKIKNVFGLRWNCRDREAEVFQVSNDDTAVAQRWLEHKQPEEKTNTDCLVKEQEKVHLGIKVGANITVTGVPGQEGAEGGPRFEVPALDEDAEYRLCLSVSPKDSRKVITWSTRDREAEVFQVSNDDTAVAQRWLEDKQPEEKTNTDCLVKEREKVHLGIKVGANITVTGVPGQEGAEGNVAEKKKVKESMKANPRKLLKYKAWLTRRSPDIRSKLNIGGDSWLLGRLAQFCLTPFVHWGLRYLSVFHLPKEPFDEDLHARIVRHPFEAQTFADPVEYLGEMSFKNFLNLPGDRAVTFSARPSGVPIDVGNSFVNVAEHVEDDVIHESVDDSGPDKLGQKRSITASLEESLSKRKDVAAGGSYKPKGKRRKHDASKRGHSKGSVPPPSLSSPFPKRVGKHPESDEHLGRTWKKAHELDSIREEIGQKHNFSNCVWRRRHQKSLTSSQLQSDGVTRRSDDVTRRSDDVTTGGDLMELSAEEAWDTIEDCAKCNKQWKNQTSTISDQSIANLKAQLVGIEMVRVRIPRCMSWLGSTNRYDEHIGSLGMMDNEVGNTSPQSTLQVLLSFDVYTSLATFSKEVEETLGTSMEVEPLNHTKLKDVGLDTCNHDISLSYREVPSFDEPEPQPQALPNCPSLDVSLGVERGTAPPIKQYSPGNFRMKEVDHLTFHTPSSPHVAYSHPDVYCYYHTCIDDLKKYYGFKPGLLRQGRSLGVDFFEFADERK